MGAFGDDSLEKEAWETAGLIKNNLLQARKHNQNYVKISSKTAPDFT